MAKKKAVSSTGGTSASVSTRQRSASAAAGTRQPALPGAGSQPVFSHEQIGRVAGEVWHVLSDNGQLTLTTLKKSIDAPADLVLAAVGWLAREGKLEFAASGRSAKVSLR